MKTPKSSPYGTTFDKHQFTKQINFSIPIIMKLGFSALDAHVLDRFIRFVDKTPTDVWTSNGIIAYREGCSKRSVSRALSKAVKKKLIIVTREAKVPPAPNLNIKVKLEDMCRHYNIVPLLLAMAKEEMEKEPEVEAEEKPKSTAKFGKAKYNNPNDLEDLPDEATHGWKTCKECHRFGPPNCSCSEDKTLN